MAVHSSILAWKISWTEEPGGLQSMGSQRVGHDWVTNTTLLASVHSSAAAKLLQSCPTLCDPMDCSPPVSSLHGILQARILDGLPCPPPGDLPDPGIEPKSPALATGSLPLGQCGKLSVI